MAAFELEHDVVAVHLALPVCRFLFDRHPQKRTRLVRPSLLVFDCVSFCWNVSQDARLQLKGRTTVRSSHYEAHVGDPVFGPAS